MYTIKYVNFLRLHNYYWQLLLVIIICIAMFFLLANFQVNKSS